MTRHAPALLLLSIIAIAGWSYNVNYDTRAALDRLSDLRSEIAEEREALQVLRVEWAYLNAPDRLAALVAEHKGALGLVPLVPEALGIAAAVPYPPRETPIPAPVAPEALIAAARPAPERAGRAPESGPIVVAALSDRPGTAAAMPAARDASLSPVPAGHRSKAPETVPVALEAAIAAALVELGVPLEDGAALRGPRGGVIAIPAARPAAWSRR